jgi:hypothetical protein
VFAQLEDLEVLAVVRQALHLDLERELLIKVTLVDPMVVVVLLEEQT